MKALILKQKTESLAERALENVTCWSLYQAYLSIQAVPKIRRSTYDWKSAKQRLLPPAMLRYYFVSSINTCEMKLVVFQSKFKSNQTTKQTTDRQTNKQTNKQTKTYPLHDFRSIIVEISNGKRRRNQVPKTKRYTFCHVTLVKYQN